MSPTPAPLKIRRALLTVSDKAGLVELGHALVASGTELVATGKTAQVLEAAGLKVVPIERISGSPEAFQGRMKTLSFPVCSGILYRRGDADDARDLAKLSILPIDCVVVNFYPFEAALKKEGITRAQLIEEIDIGGPTLVRAAAKNAPDVLVLTAPGQYPGVIAELLGAGAVAGATSLRCAAEAWQRVEAYDVAIASELGAPRGGTRKLRYGENPHQSGELEFGLDSPIAWEVKLTPSEISYNNILDLSAAYGLASDIREIDPEATGVVIIKHNNPCGVAMIPRSFPRAQLTALERAWEGDPVSAFGGVLAFTDPIEPETARWLSEKFVELIGAPGLEPGSPVLTTMLARRKNLKALAIRRFGEVSRTTAVNVPGGVLKQGADLGLDLEFRSVTRQPWPDSLRELAQFGVAVSRTLKSNALALVRRLGTGMAGEGGFQLVGTGQGQPNRVEALEKLAIPRARAVLKESGGEMGDCILVSDAFFPFRDTVDLAAAAGIRAIVQPGGSIKDAESVQACDEHGVAMALTGVRHFRH